MGDDWRIDDENLQMGADLEQRREKEAAEERQQGEQPEINGRIRRGLLLLGLAGHSHHRLCLDRDLLRGLQLTRQRTAATEAT